MKRRCMIFLCLLLMMILPSVSGASGWSADLEPLEWSWVPGEAASFSGTVIFGDYSADESLVLRLTAESSSSVPQDERIIFSSVGGKQLKIRNQKSEYLISDPQGLEVHFTGNWLLPENQRIDDITIFLTVYREDGSRLCESSFTMIQKQDAVDGQLKKLPDPEGLITYLLIAAAVVWLLAVIRMIHHRKKENKHADL